MELIPQGFWGINVVNVLIPDLRCFYPRVFMGHRFIKFTGLWVLVFVARRGSLSLSSENQPRLTSSNPRPTPFYTCCWYMLCSYD